MMCTLSGPQIMLRGHIFDSIAQNVVPLLISKHSKNSVSLTILLSCNSKVFQITSAFVLAQKSLWLAAL